MRSEDCSPQGFLSWDWSELTGATVSVRAEKFPSSHFFFCLSNSGSHLGSHREEIQAGCTLEVAEGSTSTGMRGLVSHAKPKGFFFFFVLQNQTKSPW